MRDRDCQAREDLRQVFIFHYLKPKILLLLYMSASKKYSAYHHECLHLISSVEAGRFITLCYYYKKPERLFYTAVLFLEIIAGIVN